MKIYFFTVAPGEIFYPLLQIMHSSVHVSSSLLPASFHHRTMPIKGLNQLLWVKKCIFLPLCAFSSFLQLEFFAQGSDIPA